MKKRKYSIRLLDYFIDIETRKAQIYKNLSKISSYPIDFRNMWKKLFEEEKQHLNYWKYLKRYNYAVSLFEEENPYLNELEVVLDNIKKVSYKFRKNTLSLKEAFDITLNYEFKLIVSSPMYKFLFTHDIILKKGVFNPKDNYDDHLKKVIDMGLKFYDKNSTEFTLIDAFKNLSDKCFKLAKESISDPLTGTKDRMYFFENSEFLVELAKREKKNLSVFYMDIDDFKDINDSYGHQAGDNVLKKVSEVISKNIRGVDIFSRIGGDEFAVVFYGLKNPKFLKKRLEKDIEKLVIRYKRKKIKVSVSIGHSRLFPEENKSFNNALVEADRKMYEEKSRKKHTRT